MCKEEDGGYFAIKGFLYQFDKSIIEILSVSEKTIVHVEKIQDINYDNYVIQVKHKESSKYSNSKIRDPIIKLLDLFVEDQNKKFCLYAYFQDKVEEEIAYKDIEELKKVLQYRAPEVNKKLLAKYSDKVLEEFIKNFKIVFSINYIEQFEHVLQLIQNRLKVEEEEAILFHSLIRDYLMKIAIKPNKDDRNITFDGLKQYLSQCRNITFSSMYQEILGNQRYLEIIKKKFFTFRSANINKFNRLFIIECNEDELQGELRKLIESIYHKFYRVGKSPAPYVLFKGINKQILNEVKQELLDDEIYFSDGTYFDGDKFRIDKLIKDGDKEHICIKFLDEQSINEVMGEVGFKEIYNIHSKQRYSLNSNAIINTFKLNSLNELIQVLS